MRDRRYWSSFIGYLFRNSFLAHIPLFTFSTADIFRFNILVVRARSGGGYDAKVMKMGGKNMNSLVMNLFEFVRRADTSAPVLTIILNRVRIVIIITSLNIGARFFSIFVSANNSIHNRNKRRLVITDRQTI